MQVGRRSLLISGSLLGLAADFAVAIVFALSYSGGPYLPTGASIAAIVLVSFHIFCCSQNTLQALLCLCPSRSVQMREDDQIVGG